MPISQQTLFERWREMRRCHHAERELRAALAELNDHLLRDIGLQPRRSARVRGL
ncbi:DUF1127 domain-containing protein [Phyllobacterium salinisoli]|uniref:DUF1127 domain-containing protein n=1 Tax=Phyllobacterium salinisoli TaxID=1899321 RepID=A0A368K9H7_9HYPH|nr:DUF1127 domain-containing protein [Phyllobacterium salinisoli]